MIQVELKITGVALNNTVNRQVALLEVPSGDRISRKKQVLSAKGRFDEE